jgi:hypothetical protein
MKCPTCNQEMEMRETRFTHSDGKEGEAKEYTHTTYQCKTDDIWVTTEIPKSQS